MLTVRFNEKLTSPSVSLSCLKLVQKTGSKVTVDPRAEHLKKDVVEVVVPSGESVSTSDVNGARLIARFSQNGLYGDADVSASQIDTWIEFAHNTLSRKDSVDDIVKELSEKVNEGTFLVGKSLTLADLAVIAALPQGVTEKSAGIKKWADSIRAVIDGSNATPTPKPKQAPKLDAKPANGTSTAVEAATDREGAPGTNFIRQIVENDLKTGKHKSIVTRFPPEPNGFLHLGHAKAIIVNFGMAKDFGGRCHLRMDDTNPTKENQRYIDQIQTDIKWLGFDWKEHMYYASDYFDQLYAWAEQLIVEGYAYVDDQTAEEIKANRGDVNTPGVNSPWRDRSVEENLDLFRRMKAGEFKEGERVLRAKIDMAAGNMNMRDPVMYRILYAHHPRTEHKWCIYPMYDYAHGQSDSLEGITHSLCSLEFELHRPLYEWFQEKLDIPRTRQIEFARFSMTYMMMSKRKLLALVTEGHVKDWDDPRMPTLSGARRRGVPPKALHAMCEKIGVAKRENLIQLDLLESCIREELHETAVRRFGVLDPLKVVITNFESGKVEWFDAPNHPDADKASMGTRPIAFTREIYIEKEDFMETPSAKFYRLAPGQEVRLRFGYWIKCTEVVKDSSGNILHIKATFDPQTRNGEAPADGRKVKATLHWISADPRYHRKAEVRLYDRLFKSPLPDDAPEGSDWRDNISPDSLRVVEGLVEAAVAEAKAGDPIQLERIGFFTPDFDHTTDKPILNRTVGLADTFAKEVKGPDADKEAARVAREKAQADRLKKKEEREARAKAKTEGKA